MSRSERRRIPGSSARDRGVAITAVALLAVGGGVMLSQPSDAADGDGLRRSADARNCRVARGGAQAGAQATSATVSANNDNAGRQANRNQQGVDPRCQTGAAASAAETVGGGANDGAVAGAANGAAGETVGDGAGNGANAGETVGNGADAGAANGAGNGANAGETVGNGDNAGNAADNGANAGVANGVDGQVVGDAGANQDAAAAAEATNNANGAQPTQDQAGDGSQLQILGNNCNNSNLPAHNGFQDGDRCVSTAFGEVGASGNNASLLISAAPRQVRVGQQFNLRVSTRNLIRDRFLAAAQGGYYRESSFLNGQGLTRGHFHTACRMLGNRREAPNPDPAPAFFVATEDGGGSARPDTVTVRVAGLPNRGEAQCAVWAGDGSHRLPMMQRANQIPAFDVVRITVR